MTERGHRLVLASASPRRREILESMGLRFDVVVSDVVEVRAPFEDALAYTQRLATAKASAVAERVRSEDPTAMVLGADTVVVADSEILEKPRDEAEGMRMLLSLAGRTHEVATAFALVHASRGVVHTGVSVTKVTFRAIRSEEAQRYVATGEGRDKAGGYAVQGIASGFVTRIEGSYSNVVGLPASDVLSALLQKGVVTAWP